MNRLLRFLWLWLLILCCINLEAVQAQDTLPEPTMQEAAEVFNRQNWPQAIKAYGAIVEREPENGLAWLRLGLSQYGAGTHQKALESFTKSDELGFAQAIARFHMARCHSHLGNTEDAFDWLDKALQSGYSNVKQLEKEPAFSALSSDQRFAGLVKKADQNARPCEYDERHRQLDFWIGEWDVFSPRGQRVGGNRIHKIQTGCGIQENWTSQGGGTGMSINYFEPESQQWKQNWVSANGTIILLHGEFKDGAMHFTSGKNIGLNGKSELSRMTLTPLEDGSVIQLIEQSRDQGETWYVWFKGKYVRKTAASGG